MKESIAGGGNKKRFQYCTYPSGQEIIFLRAIQGHSGRNFFDPSLQEKCINSERFLRVHLSCRMCNQSTFHHQFGTDTWMSKFEQQTDSVLSLCGSQRQESQGSSYDRLESTASCTIRADSVEKTSRRSKLGRHQSCSKKG